MSEFLPTPPSDWFGELEPTSWQDPRREAEEARSRWRGRAAQWRALSLARAVFGRETTASLTGSAPGFGFRGLLHLEVPFRGLEDHRFRESVFLSWVAGDPVLSCNPFIFIFQASPVRRSGG